MTPPLDVAQLRFMLRASLDYQGGPSLIVADQDSVLACELGGLYQQALPDGHHLSFANIEAEALIRQFRELTNGALVILIQSRSFRLNGFRIRVELFKQGVKVIEHCNLARYDQVTAPRYLASLRYDESYYRETGSWLKRCLDEATTLLIEGPCTSLAVTGRLEPAMLNTGDFSSTKNIGSMFPIGEVFTEAEDLQALSGEVDLFAFADASFDMNWPATPIRVAIAGGQVRAATNSTPRFDDLLAQIARDEGAVWVRELGFGLNRSFDCNNRVEDIGAFERQCGVHLSLGLKHGVYKKPSIRHKDTKYHVDVFPLATRVRAGEHELFDGHRWCTPVGH